MTADITKSDIKKRMETFLQGCRENDLEKVQTANGENQPVELINILEIHAMKISKTQYTRSILFIPYTKYTTIISLARNKRTLLHYACLHSTSAIVKYIIDRYVFHNRIPTEQDINKDTPLHIAIQSRNISIITELLNGISKLDKDRIKKILDTKNKDGNTPYHLISKWYSHNLRKKIEICEVSHMMGFFQKFNANDSIKNKKGKTPIDLKCKLIDTCASHIIDPELGWKDSVFDPELGCSPEFDIDLGGGNQTRRRQTKGKKSRRRRP